METLRELLIEDYEQCMELWGKTEGMALSDADSKESIHRYLVRNPGMSFVATEGDRVIGTILCGHDGRRGYIYHVAVDPACRGRAIGQKLAKAGLDKLREEGIAKCHIMVIEENEIGNYFWAKSGWSRRDGILLYSSNT
ncbi:GCN5 family acetyltransferase [Paenibacillus sp. SSG-1]|uniref:N-acetyltransferase n=1 Tax=Paenibacillus cineris TaxID=237530 RepID=A0ABQ4L723_9BACL|nr:MULTISPECIES: GNAT family N-acetyltransferase [Paenibacillus]OXL81830.1 GCN5 family acetyltransferase [Paenibacillus sp. SSG-1]GIO52100.1 N-acetyltransferase [Paenibacillus cineris]